jgi:hypothetical protein
MFLITNKLDLNEETRFTISDTRTDFVNRSDNLG